MYSFDMAEATDDGAVDEIEVVVVATEDEVDVATVVELDDELLVTVELAVD